jgi:hypothetical protein
MALGIFAALLVRTAAGAPTQSTCQQIVIAGEVNAGQEWKRAFGQGWVFRVLPIDTSKTPPGQAAYSGWDLVVDREPPAGFPDALLLATPPYNSINQHEVGTTFGLRAQDAIGWNPRSFHFLSNEPDFSASQLVFRQMSLGPAAAIAPLSAAGHKHGSELAARRLLDFVRKSSVGEFRILDARLTPGVADAAPFAENWAVQSARTPHTFQPAYAGKPTPLGTLEWVRFSVTLWLPESWKAPAVLHATRSACGE